MQEEIWKEVPSKPGIKASSWGRICLPPREVKMPNGGIRSHNPKPRYGTKCRSHKNAKHVYLRIVNRFYGTLKVHRLICEAFHGPAPKDKPIVIHLDEDATNNRPENLKWGTQKENLNMPKFIEYCKSRTGENSPYIKGIKNKRLLQESSQC